ncbi:MAG: hypothetical protein AAF529_20190 [Pseudomonadota bacterium]
MSELDAPDRMADEAEHRRLLARRANNSEPLQLREEIATPGAVTLSTEGVTLLLSAAGAITATLPNGRDVDIGKVKFLVMNNAANASTVSVTTHETANPTVYTFNAVGDFVSLTWTGATWAVLKTLGV